MWGFASRGGSIGKGRRRGEVYFFLFFSWQLGVQRRRGAERESHRVRTRRRQSTEKQTLCTAVCCDSRHFRRFQWWQVRSKPRLNAANSRNVAFLWISSTLKLKATAGKFPLVSATRPALRLSFIRFVWAFFSSGFVVRFTWLQGNAATTRPPAPPPPPLESNETGSGEKARERSLTLKLFPSAVALLLPLPVTCVQSESKLSDLISALEEFLYHQQWDVCHSECHCAVSISCNRVALSSVRHRLLLFLAC